MKPEEPRIGNTKQPRILTPSEEQENLNIAVMRLKICEINRKLLAKGAKLTLYELGKKLNKYEEETRHKYYT